MKKCSPILFLFCLFTSINSPLLAQEILPPVNAWKGASEKLIVDKNHQWVTPFELSGLTESPDYNTTMSWFVKLTKASSYLSMVGIGMSEQNRAIQMVIASKDKAFTSKELANSSKPLVLVHAGIHAGEIDGKDAGMMLLRDIAFGSKLGLLDNVNLLFIPILNVDGHERKSKYGRVNQRGPEEMGWRTNAQNLNLNRDYSKIETAGVQAVINVINDYNPDLYIDVHVTDGADYQYDITYGYVVRGGYSPNITHWFKTYFQEEVDNALSKNGHIPGPLLFALNEEDFSAGNMDYAYSPRFSQSYGDARHLPSILVENHSLKPFRQRVLGTYIFLEQSIKSVSKHIAELKKAIQSDREQRYDSLAIKYGFRQNTVDSMQLLGIESVKKKSTITGASYVQWTGKPVNQKILNVIMDIPILSVKMPKAYWIPAEWSTIIEKIKAHGIKVEIINETRDVSVEQYFIKEYKLNNEPFEGKVRIENFSLEKKNRKVTYHPGSARITTDQPLSELTALLLEPESPDSFFQWGYFHSILSQTEYIENYVIEPLAAKMLKEDDDLRKRFEAKMKSDSSFAASPKEIYNWFYSQTPYHDKEWKIIPIGREN